MIERRTIIVSGAPGTGKSTVRAQAPYALRPLLGETAAFDTDEFYTFFDPLWTTNNRAWWQLARYTCLATAHALFEQGIATVVISSNGLYTAEDVNQVLRRLGPLSAVYHITLDADHAVVVERVRRRGDLAQHPPEWLHDWLRHIRGHYRPWTSVIDTSSLSPAAVLDDCVEQVRLPARALPVEVT